MLEYKLLGYAPIFDHAESDKAIIFELKRLFFEPFNDFVSNMA